MALKKIMLNLDEGLLSDIEEYAGKMHLNRTAAISVLCSTALQAQKGISTLDEMIKIYKAEKSLQNGDGVVQLDK